MSNASSLINQLDSSINSFEGRVNGRVNGVYNSTNTVHSTAVAYCKTASDSRDHSAEKR